MLEQLRLQRIKRFNRLKKSFFRAKPQKIPEFPLYLKRGIENYYKDLEEGIIRRYEVPAEDLLRKYRNLISDPSMFYINTKKAEVSVPWVMKVKKRCDRDTVDLRPEYYPPAFVWGIAHELTHVDTRKKFGEKYNEIRRKNFTFESLEALTDLGAAGILFRKLDKDALYQIYQYRSAITPKLPGTKGAAYMVGDFKALDIARVGKDPLNIYRKITEIPKHFPDAKIVLEKGGFKVLDSQGRDITKKAFSKVRITGKVLRILTRKEY